MVKTTRFDTPKKGKVLLGLFQACELNDAVGLYRGVIKYFGKKGHCMEELDYNFLTGKRDFPAGAIKHQGFYEYYFHYRDSTIRVGGFFRKVGLGSIGLEVVTEKKETLDVVRNELTKKFPVKYLGMFNE